MGFEILYKQALLLQASHRLTKFVICLLDEGEIGSIQARWIEGLTDQHIVCLLWIEKVHRLCEPILTLALLQDRPAVVDALHYLSEELRDEVISQLCGDGDGRCIVGMCLNKSIGAHLIGSLVITPCCDLVVDIATIRKAEIQLLFV